MFVEKKEHRVVFEDGWVAVIRAQWTAGDMDDEVEP